MANRDRDLGRERITAIPSEKLANSGDEQHGTEIEAMSKTSSDRISSEDDADPGGLAGVERIRATTQAWTKPWLITAFIL